MSNEIKSRPILFSAPMVRAILDGTKSQTRRVIKPPSDENEGSVYELFDNRGQVPAKHATFGAIGTNERRSNYGVEFRCPYGAPGDRLWVREKWQTTVSENDFKHYGAGVSYAATDPNPWINEAANPWITPIFMPRWASRITLEITDIRVERLQGISEDDAKAEGCDGDCPIGYLPVYQSAPFAYHYAQIWESINGAGSWDKNPYVFAISFKRVLP